MQAPPRKWRNLGHFFGRSSFAAHAVVSERNVIPVPKDLPLELLGPLGCGIQTGSGAVMNRLKPEPGSTIAVFGVGSVGLSAIMAAKVMNCSMIIALDIHDNRLELAKELGATHTINSKHGDVLGEILGLTNNGVNYTVDTTGRPEVLRNAVDCLTTLGTAAVVGAPPSGTEVTFGVSKILNERTITGVLMGSGVPQIFIPQLLDLYKNGHFPFDKLINSMIWKKLILQLRNLRKVL